MQMTNSDLFWRLERQKYRKHPDRIIKIVDTCIGLLPYWEYQMLIDKKAITERGITMDGYVVRTASGELLYEGKEFSKAKQANEEKKGSVLVKGSYTYSTY